MVLLRSLALLLSISVGAANQPDFLADVVAHRQLDEIVDHSVEIPDVAHGAYCTAITGWYNSCNEPTVGAPDTASVCDGAALLPLNKPLFIDLTTCYTNPNLGEKSVSFFGETPAKNKIMEFHLIFKNQAAQEYYKGVDCLSNGACRCPQSIQKLKKQWLAAGGCEDTDDYECLGEDFWGDTDTCFVPATILNGPNNVTCALAAKLQQFGPCDTILDIPDPAYDAYCTGITGWYDTCDQVPLGNPNQDSACDTGTFNPLNDPLFIDLNTCYSNPSIGERSVSFFGKGADGYVKEFHMIFNDSNDATKYKPTNCKDTGACDCTQSLMDLKAQFLQKGGCVDTTAYTCEWDDFFGATDRCFVPAAKDFGDAGYNCAMVARIEKFEPCDKAALGGGGASGTIPAVVPAQPVAKPTPPPVVAPTPPPVVAPTPLPVAAQIPTGGNTIGNAVITTPPFSDASAAIPDQKDTPKRDENIVIPGAAHLAYCTAIMGWYNTCTNPGANAPEGASVCDGGTYTAMEDPVFIDLNTCYSNPSLGEKSISFFGETPDKKKIMEFHLLFAEGIKHPYGPLNCDASGVCECTPTITALKQQFLSAGGCSDTDAYSCMSEDFYGDNEECFVPMTQLVGADGIICSMVARVQQFEPCDMVLDIPDAAVDSYCTAITGWYDTCVEEASDPEDDVCDAGGFDGLMDPLFIDFDHCYSNPDLHGQSVSFFGQASDGLVHEFHFIAKEPNSKYAPESCDENGKCEFSKELKKLKKKFLKDGKCEPTDDYYCLSDEFYGDTDRCWVPATADFGGENGFHCSMLARVEQFDPCVRSIAYNESATKSDGKAGARDIILRTLFVIFIAGIVWCAYTRCMPILHKRHARLMAMKSPEDEEDEVVMVRRGGNVYQDDPDLPSASAQFRSGISGTFGLS
eukprot:CAMPEP_0119008920 /NCGR_PEP_ID=MMETSP1176-20130426/4026_1 /TAXON_ID=265551 /ORGANISM="Synedropsis recta cf, Strain CCMP1620" /LENGTH=912 /DNA_ID=CAMNT_0006961339 /DNA_START=54 /DNA_END=2792 /DNA_ORIENTATION=-